MSDKALVSPKSAMHHALNIQDVLLNIFGQFDLSDTRRETAPLAALARTCRAFKEPTLDVLWRELLDPSPLARCVPDASQCREMILARRCYSFSRPLTQIELGTLRGYARCIISMIQKDSAPQVDWESVATFLNPVIPSTEPLLPNLRHLDCGRTIGIKELLCLPFPSLSSLHILFLPENLSLLRDSLVSLRTSSPNIRRLSVRLRRGNDTFSNFFFDCTRWWKDLQTVEYDSGLFKLDELVDLTCIPALTQLRLRLDTLTTPKHTLPNSPILFSRVQGLILSSDVLSTTAHILPQFQLPAIKDLTSHFDFGDPHCDQDILKFLTSVQMTTPRIQTLTLIQTTNGGYTVPMSVCFEDLMPSTALSNLCRIKISLQRKVGIRNNELLTLASAWPRLEHFLINESWGWNTLGPGEGAPPGGITPDGLLQLLGVCRSLSKVALAMDLRGYTGVSQALLSLTGLTSALPQELSINVLDSVIEVESVPALAVFIAGIVSHPDFPFYAWKVQVKKRVYMERWEDACALAKKVRLHPPSSRYVFFRV